MNLTKNFRFRKPEGTDPINIEDLNDNFDLLDEELEKRPTGTDDISATIVTFEKASERANIASKETLAILFGKIMKTFSDLKKVAFSGSYKDLEEKPVLGSGAGASVIESVDDLAAVTEEGYIVGGKAGAQIINNLKGFEPVLDTTGQITGYKTSVGGADTVFPFRKEPQFLSDNIIYNRYIKYTNTSSRDQLVFGMAAYYFFDDILKAEYRTGGKVNILHVTKESSHSFVIIGVTAILSPGGSIEMYTHNATSSQGDSHSKVGYMVFDF